MTAATMTDTILHLGFRVSGRQSRDHVIEVDDFEILDAARDCAQILAANGWIDVRVNEVHEDLVLGEIYEVELVEASA